MNRPVHRLEVDQLRVKIQFIATVACWGSFHKGAKRENGAPSLVITQNKTCLKYFCFDSSPTAYSQMLFASVEIVHEVKSHII